MSGREQAEAIAASIALRIPVDPVQLFAEIDHDEDDSHGHQHQPAHPGRKPV